MFIPIKDYAGYSINEKGEILHHAKTIIHAGGVRRQKDRILARSGRQNEGVRIQSKWVNWQKLLLEYFPDTILEYSCETITKQEWLRRIRKPL